MVNPYDSYAKRSSALKDLSPKDLDNSLKIFAVFFDIVAQIISWILYFAIPRDMLYTFPWYVNLVVTLAVSRILSYFVIRKYKRESQGLENNPSIDNVDKAFVKGLGFRRKGDMDALKQSPEVNKLLAENKAFVGKLFYEFGLIMAGVQASIASGAIILILRVIFGIFFGS